MQQIEDRLKKLGMPEYAQRFAESDIDASVRISGPQRAWRLRRTSANQAIQWALRNRSRAASGWHNDAQRVEHSGPDGGALRTERYEVIDPRRLSPEHREGLKAALLAAVALPREGEA
jgi:hypothetical protein